jgi:hypothetical protein
MLITVIGNCDVTPAPVLRPKRHFWKFWIFARKSRQHSYIINMKMISVPWITTTQLSELVGASPHVIRLRIIGGMVKGMGSDGMNGRKSPNRRWTANEVEKIVEHFKRFPLLSHGGYRYGTRRQK